MSVFIAKPLKSLLEYWEELNLYAEFRRATRTRIQDYGDRSLKEFGEELSALNFPHLGSEVNSIGYLQRAISGYEKLGSVMKGDSFAHPTGFLPHVPKDFREIFGADVLRFALSDHVSTQLLTPYFLLGWLETKKACVITDQVALPLVRLDEENYFDRLPYHSFLLQTRNSLSVEGPIGELQEYENFIVCKDESVCRIFTFPNAVQEFGSGYDHAIIRDANKKMLASRKKIGNVNYLKQYAEHWETAHPLSLMNVFIALTIDVATGELIEVTSDNEPVRRSLYSSREMSEKMLVDYSRISVIAEMVNGFLKLVNDLPPAKVTIAEFPVTGKEKQKPPLDWFELPVNAVEHFRTIADGSERVIKLDRGAGSEKAPHVRRAHIRRIVKKDGTVIERRIEEVMVREDKLTTEVLQGGALIITE